MMATPCAGCRNDEAGTRLSRTRTSQPRPRAAPHANLGVIYRQAGKLNESASELEQAVKINPNQPIYLKPARRDSYRHLGKFDKGPRDAYEKARSHSTRTTRRLR